jgi:hypothetical protein
MEGDERLHPVGSNTLHDAAIVLNGMVVELADARFDATPLQGEPMRVVAELTHETEVVRITLELLACRARLKRQSAGLLVNPPVVKVVPALNLVGGRG